MSKFGFFTRFTVIYTLAMAAAGIAITLLGVGMASGVIEHASFAPSQGR